MGERLPVMPLSFLLFIQAHKNFGNGFFQHHFRASHDGGAIFWFCLLHELSHLAHNISSNAKLIVDEMEFGKQKEKRQDSLEAEADQIARDALIPRKYQLEPLSEKSPSRKQVLTIADKLKIHPCDYRWTNPIS